MYKTKHKQSIYVLHIQNAYTVVIGVSSSFWLITIYCVCHNMDAFLEKQ